MSIWKASLDTANHWYEISWWGLLAAGSATAIAAFVTVAFLFIQFWSSSVRDQYADKERLQLKSDTAKANERAAQANARAAEAGRSAGDATLKAAQANERAAKAELELAKYKAPRWLDDKQVGQLVHSLSRFKGARFRILTYPEDPECVGIAERVGQAIRDRAGWVFVPWERGTMIVGVVTGMQVFISNDAPSEQREAAEALVKAIAGEGLQIELRHDPTYKTEMMIRVGKKM